LDADDPCRSGLEIPADVPLVRWPVRWWHEHADALPAELVRRVAEHALRGGVHGLDHAVLIADDDGVRRSIDDRPRARLGRPQLDQSVKVPVLNRPHVALQVVERHAHPEVGAVHLGHAPARRLRGAVPEILGWRLPRQLASRHARRSANDEPAPLRAAGGRAR
jgi:hypothetical protein